MPAGPWSTPVKVIDQPMLEDPCPFWDDDGQAWLVHSRHGAGPLILHRMSPDGTRVLDAGEVIVEDKVNLPILEGPKFYKRNGYYYIFAPFGGGGERRAGRVARPQHPRVRMNGGSCSNRASTQLRGPAPGRLGRDPLGPGLVRPFQLDRRVRAHRASRAGEMGR